MVFDFPSESVVRNTQVGTAVANTELTTIDNANASSLGTVAILTVEPAAHIKIGWGTGVIGSAGTAPAAVTAVATEDATGVSIYLLAGVPFVIRAVPGRWVSHVRVNASSTPVVRVTYIN